MTNETQCVTLHVASKARGRLGIYRKRWVHACYSMVIINTLGCQRILRIKHLFKLYRTLNQNDVGNILIDTRRHSANKNSTMTTQWDKYETGVREVLCSMTEILGRFCQ